MIASPPMAHAQDATATPKDAVAEDAHAEGDVVITGARAVAATKTDTPLIEVPQAISVITAQEFKDRTVVDFQDIYRYSAGVSANNSVDSRGDFVVTRGFDAAQYVDGLKRMPDFIYGARLEPFTLERAEVLRGPSSVLYGAGGPGGVLNGVSKVPQFEFAGLAGITGGTDKRIQGQIDITAPLTENVAARFVGVARNAQNQWHLPDDRVLVNPSLRFRFGTGTDITLIGLYQKDKQGSLGYVLLDNSRLNTDRSRRVKFDFFAGEPDFSGMDTEYSVASIIVNQRFGDNVSFRSASRYSDMNTDYQEVLPRYLANPFADAARTELRREFYVNYENSRVFNSDNNLSATLNIGPLENKLLAGADYTWFKQSKNEGFSYDDLVIPGSFPYPSPPPINIFNPQYGAPINTGAFNFLDYKSSQIGLYLQDQISYADRVHVVLGIRRDRATSERNGVKEDAQVKWSFRGGIIAEVVDGISPYFNYAESFLPVPGGDFYGNAFKPRVARQYEGGAKWEPIHGALLSVAYFDIKESNYVSQDPVNIQNFIQGGTVGSKGVEAEAVIRIPQNFDVTASYTYVNAKALTASSTVAAGDRISGQPRQLASVWGSKTVELANDWVLRAGAGVRYIGNKIDASQTFLTPSVTLVDGMLSASRGPWLASINASNLFNVKYYDICSVFTADNGHCTPAKDRTLVATLTRRF
ncbi:TonB-dependent siderophore receptor [uncultured Sphingomonas sp.]|uniref:TonB-dependent siderophore receptor n=1 Tax=uncultured Sphingomonas sp. TaxID=158754 RepID=UPI0025EF26B0|nr:TonB-dependent siderophore receptor [uncultured Sphingomonas sp.]